MITYEEIIKNIRILLADDDDDYLQMTCEFLKQVGYNVDLAKNGTEALEKLRNENYQIALLDYFMPGLTGEEIVEEVRKENKEIIIILQTGFSGQKPPIEMMKKLNIQNYHDKTEGISRLNLELISAVKIFNQQNEIELSKYKTNIIGTLISGVAEEVRSNLLTISAGIEVTNFLVQNSSSTIEKQNLEKLNKFYANNKESMERIDKVLASIISQTGESVDTVMLDKDIMDIINIIISNYLKLKNISYTSSISLRNNSFISGRVNDLIFITCEVIRKVANVCNEQNNNIELVLTEDESNWYFNIASSSVCKVSRNDLYIIKKLLFAMKNVTLESNDKAIQIVVSKV